jgi:DNA-binding NarL/FixJ family response regulator
LDDEAQTSNQDSRLTELTSRQRDVLVLLGEGHSNRDIATRLGLTEGTVKLHVGSVLRALGVSNRTKAAAVAVREGTQNRKPLTVPPIDVESDSS